MALYRKKPDLFEAFQWTGGPDQTEDPEWIVDAIKAGTVYCQGGDTPHLTIGSPAGCGSVHVGDYIIKGINGDLYPIQRESFEAFYEAVTDGAS